MNTETGCGATLALETGTLLVCDGHPIVTDYHGSTAGAVHHALDRDGLDHYWRYVIRNFDFRTSLRAKAGLVFVGVVVGFVLGYTVGIDYLPVLLN